MFGAGNELTGFWAGGRAAASVVFCSSANSTGTGTATYNISLNLSGTAGSSLVVFVIAAALNNNQVSSVTIDPSGANVACTRTVRTAGGNDFDTSEIWQAVYSGSGTVTVRISLSGNGSGTRAAAYALFNLLSTTATDTDTQGSTSSTSASTSIDVSAGGVVLSGISKTGTSNITMTGVTENSEGEYNTGSNKRGANGALESTNAQTGLSVGASWTSANFGRMATASWR